MTDTPSPAAVYFTRTAIERLQRYAPHDRALVRQLAVSAARQRADAGASLPLEIGVKGVTAAYAMLQTQYAAAHNEETKEIFTFTGEAIVAVHAAASQHVWSDDGMLAVIRQASLVARGHGHTAVTSADVREAQRQAP